MVPDPGTRWLELSVETDVEAVEAVSEILGRISAGTAVRPTRLLRDESDALAVRDDPTAPYVVTAHITDDRAATAAVEVAERALWHLQAFGLRPIGQLRVRSVVDDWTDGWRREYATQRLGRLMIVPSWLDEPAEPGDVTVRMDPGMAFGTGLHPTTRGCLRLLQTMEPMAERVLDVGCGSGILAFAALRLGAASAVAYDTDPVAVEATRANAAGNSLAARVVALEGTLPADAAEGFPLVLANLVAPVLIDLAPRLARHATTGGTLITSGILSDRGEAVVAALDDAGFRVVTRLEDGEWLSLLLERAG